MKLVVLVVLYGKKIEQSQSIQSLLHTTYRDFDLVVFNNGPKALDDDEIHQLQHQFPSVHVLQDLDNRPLSFIYNDLIQSFTGDAVVILDDDTHLSADFFDAVLNNQSSADLCLPVVIASSGEGAVYPTRHGTLIHSGALVNQFDGVFSIGSGLVIYTSLIQLFRTNGWSLFDEHYALYGVDYSLFRRISLLVDRGVFITAKIDGQIVHSMSRLEAGVSRFRLEERLIDDVLSLLHYGSSPYRVLKALTKITLTALLHRRFTEVRIILRTMLFRSHPRCFGKHKRRQLIDWDASGQ